MVFSELGRLLVLALSDIAQLNKGRGSRLINIPNKAFESGKDKIKTIAIMNDKDKLVLKSQRKTFNLAPKDWSQFIGERGERGRVLTNLYPTILSVAIA